MFYPRESEVINWKVYVESYQADSWGGVAVSFVISLALFMFIIYISQRRLEEPTFNLSMAVRFIALSQVLIRILSISISFEFFFPLRTLDFSFHYRLENVFPLNLQQCL